MPNLLSPVSEGSPTTEHFSRSLINERFHPLEMNTAHGTKCGMEEAATGLPVESTRASEVSWKIFSRDQSAGAVTMQLLRDSRRLLKRLRLDDWVQYAMRMSSTAVAVAHSYYDRLSFSLFDFLCHFPDEAEKYALVVKTLQGNDPFMHGTIAHALWCFQNHKIYEALVLDTDFMVVPLKTLLSAPDKDVLRRLAVLEERYSRYRTSPSMALGEPFDIDTRFLTEVSEETAEVIAQRLTEGALREFRQLSSRSITCGDSNLWRLGVRWDQLCYGFQEIVAVGDMNDKLVSLLLELYRLRDYFSLTAILHGLMLTGFPCDSIGHLLAFVDAQANYRHYRVSLHKEPSLPFLYPFVVDFRRGNRLALKSIFSFLLYRNQRQETG
ncbi:hypothetical protein BBP40_004010 [Aspergillus hancockii]|nr:hypothetical protein BBP40_004010 [Aspergillus hancockii]